MRRLRASTIQPNAASPTSSARKCRCRREAGLPMRPSETRISRIGPDAHGSASQSPALAKIFCEPAAMA